MIFTYKYVQKSMEKGFGKNVQYPHGISRDFLIKLVILGEALERERDRDHY